MKKVLLQVDQKARDLVSVLLIGEYLKEFGVSVHYSNPTNVVAMAAKHRPDIFMISSSEGQFLQAARYVAPRSKIVLMTQEGACTNKETTMMRHTFNGMLDCYRKGLSRVYLWGEASRKWLSEEKVYAEDAMKVVGTSRLDIYRLAEKPRKRAGGKFRVGFANRGEAVNPVPGGNPIERIEYCRKQEGSHRAYLDSGRNWEDWMWHSYATLRVNLDLIERLDGQGDVEILFRPDPFENFKSYEFLRPKYKNFRINTDPVLFNFINEIDVMVTEFSTTGIEALVLKKPVISTQKLIGPRLPEHNKKHYEFALAHMRNYWFPESQEELLGMLESARRGELDYSPDPAASERFLKDFYDWNPEGPSSAYRIAVDLMELLKSEKPPSLQELHTKEFRIPEIVDYLAAKFHLPFSLMRTILSWPWVFELRAFLLGLKSGHFKTHLRMEYYPWDLAETARIKKIFRRLKEATARFEA